MKNDFIAHEPSSEELFVEDYLMRSGIKFEAECQIDFLKGDEKSYRIVDFYLPRLDIYLEYYGLYNSTKEHRARYDKKTEVYLKNGLKTVILYPHELGFIDHAFHKKTLKVLKLKKFKNWRMLLRYKFNRFFTKSQVSLIALILFPITFLIIIEDAELRESLVFISKYLIFVGLIVLFLRAMSVMFNEE